jgi:LysM repeat protein
MKRKNLLLVFFVLVLVSGSFSQPTPALAGLTCTMYHTVKGGETLAKIAEKYKVSQGWLALINHLKDGRVLPEHKLCVQLIDTAKLQAACTQFYIVKRGEDLSKIARMYGVTWQWLARINGLSDPNHIYAGNRLCVQTGTSPGATPAPTLSSAASVIPTFSIVSVDKNHTVTVQTYNFPANRTFNVRMGRIGSRGVNGILAGTVETGSAASFKVTFVIPPGLYGLGQIAIRLESPGSGYFAYNWFYNK